MVDKNKIKELTYQFLLAIGEDPLRQGLIDTPNRVAEMCDELFSPARTKTKYITFDLDNYGGIVMVRDIDFASVCEHHILPFVGKAHIAYLPCEKVIGISKLARIVDKHAKKLQLQERLANDIAYDLSNSINAKGVAIYLEAKHLCMNIRGICRPDASTVTTVFLGEFEEFDKQQMFMDLITVSKR